VKKWREENGVVVFSSWPAAKEKGGGRFRVENEENERVLPNENFLFIPPIYTSLLSMISCQVPPNTISLHLYLTPISKVHISLPFMKYLYQQVW